jgi:proliferating cell nuclear antigen
MAFEATHNSAQTWKKIFDTLKGLIDIVNINWAGEGLRLQAMDDSHVSLVHLELRAEGFSEYECQSPLPIGISVESFSKILNCSRKGDRIHMASKDDSQLRIDFTDVSSSGGATKSFVLKCLDIDTDPVEIPETEYEVSIQMRSDTFQSICKDLNIMGDSVRIDCQEDATSFSAQGNTGQAEIKIAPCDDIKIDYQDSLKIDFDLKYLNIFAKASTLASRVEIKLGHGLPCAIRYDFTTENQTEPWGTLIYYLAPKISDDEEEEQEEAEAD